MSTSQTPAIDTTAVTLQDAARFEAAEGRSWTDLYAAAPRDWAAEAGLGSRQVGGAVVLHWVASGRRYFSRAIGLGVTTPATREHLQEIAAIWEGLGIEMFLVQSLPHCRPQAYEKWLGELGFEPFDAQDRVVRGGEPLVGGRAVSADGELTVERVTGETAEEWSDFLQRVYHLDTGPWLPKLIGRPGWHQYVAHRNGEIVGARGMHIGPDGIAWLGMDGPVPGLSTHDYEPDRSICSQIVSDGLTAGARCFIADIEAPSPAFDTPAYDYFSSLGFTRPYVRTHYTRSV
jgi:hypothetical protein